MSLLILSPTFHQTFFTILMTLVAISNLGVFSSSSFSTGLNQESFDYRAYPPKSYFLESKDKKTGNSQNSQNQGCKSIETEIQVSKEEKEVGGQLVRVCEGIVKVAKCEGVCTSRLRPWINSPSGFLKECKCCREGAMSEKVVTLSVCFDAGGRRLEGQSLEITISEPEQCSCVECA